MFRNICAKKSSHLFILGDLNSKEINWVNYSCNTNERVGRKSLRN